MKNLLFLTIVVLTFCITGFGQTEKEADKTRKKEDKMTAEDLVSKHLASIGSAESLAAVKSRVMVGNGKLTSKLGYAGQLAGPVQFASSGDKVLFAMIFNSNDYPYEKGAYDGEDVTVGYPSGNKSMLANFLKAQNVIFKQGLLGGTLSSAWSLLNSNSRKSKLEFAGTEKINNHQFYKLKYLPAKGGGNLKISLYFDTETLRHIISKYEYVVIPGIGASRETNASQKQSSYTMIEQFSDFVAVEKLTLPQTYTINLTVQEQDTTNSLEWTMKFSKFFFNEPLDASSFKVS